MLSLDLIITGVASGILTSDNTNVSLNNTVTIGSRTYTFKLEKATATLTSDNTNVSDGDIVTIGGQDYTLVTALTEDGANPGEVVIGADADTTLGNLIAAINKAAGGGTKYDSATVANPAVTAGTVSAHAFTVTAKTAGAAGNLVEVSTDAAHLTWGDDVETLSNGYDPSKDEIFIGANADASLGKLVDAINGTFTGITAHADVTASAVASHATTVTAKLAGSAGNTIATTDEADHLSWGATTLGGGIGGPLKELTLDDDGTFYTNPINVSEYSELIAFLTVHDVAGVTGTLDVKFQLSADGENWVDDDSMTQVTTAKTTTLKRITSNFGEWLRAVISLGGTSPEYKISLALGAK